MIAGALSFTAMNSMVKQVERLPAFELVFFRSIIACIITLGLLVYYKIPLLGNQRKLLILRSLAGLIAIVLFFTGLQRLQLGDAVALRYLSPIFALFFATFFLKEKIKNIQWLFISFAFIGVMILKGFSGKIPTSGLVIMLLAAFFTGIVYVMIRYLSHKDHYLVIVFYFMTLSTVIGGIVSMFVWSQPQGIEWLFLVALSISGFFGQIFMTMALKGEEANKIVPLKYTEVIFTLIIGIVFFNESYNLYSLFGIALILSALLGNLLAKRKETSDA